MMDEVVLGGDPPLTVTLRRSVRSRQMSLRVSRLDGRVTLTLPPQASRRAAVAFAEERAGWIRRHLADLALPEPVGLGSRLCVDGLDVRIATGPRTELRRREGVLAVSRRARSVPGAAAGLLKTLARDRLTVACDGYAARLGRSYARLVLRDPRSRWGSCTAEGALMFSWRLILAPPEVLDYVAAHEVAHLVEMNHAPAFWSVVGALRPGFAAERAWLRREGAGLHRYRFTAAER